jgi:hypothetical protein
MKNTLYFRVNTSELLKEIMSNFAGDRNGGVLFVPINTFQNLLAQLAQRCTEMNDPILNRICFDLALYELPSPTSPEYNKLIKKVYNEERKFLKRLNAEK